MSKKNNTQEAPVEQPAPPPSVESFRDGIPCTETPCTDTNGNPCNPPTVLIAMKVKDICRVKRGVHCVVVLDFDANAILRKAKTACVLTDSEYRIQTGDLIHFEVKHGGVGLRNIEHPLNKSLYEATYVTTNKDSNGQSLVCFREKAGYTFHEGGIGHTFPEDTITYLEPCDPS